MTKEHPNIPVLQKNEVWDILSVYTSQDEDLVQRKLSFLSL